MTRLSPTPTPTTRARAIILSSSLGFRTQSRRSIRVRMICRSACLASKFAVKQDRRRSTQTIGCRSRRSTVPKISTSPTRSETTYGLRTYSGAVVFCPLKQQLSQEVRPVGVAEAVVARRYRADLRRAVDPGEHPVARLLNLAQQPVDIPSHELALPVRRPCPQSARRARAAGSSSSRSCPARCSSARC